MCKQLVQGCTRQRGGLDSNPRPNHSATEPHLSIKAYNNISDNNNNNRGPTSAGHHICTLPTARANRCVRLRSRVTAPAPPPAEICSAATTTTTTLNLPSSARFCVYAQCLTSSPSTPTSGPSWICRRTCSRPFQPKLCTEFAFADCGEQTEMGD